MNNAFVTALLVAVIGGVIASLISAAIIRNQIDTGLRGKTMGVLGL